MNKNQVLPEIETTDRSNNSYFETVKLNVAEYTEPEDLSLSSLFGDKNFVDVNPFVYENEFLSDSKTSIFTELSDKIRTISLPTKKIKLAMAGTLALVGIFALGTTVSQIYQNNYVADASPLSQIAVQNIESKTNSIKTIVASGEIYSEGDFINYKPKQDETLVKISEKTNISPDTIKLFNNISSDKELHSKGKIVLPTLNGDVVKIKSGETIGSLAVRYRVSVNRIFDLNKSHLKNPHFLQIGQQLFVPSEENLSTKSETKISDNSDKKANETKSAQNTDKKKTPAKYASVSRENNIIHKLASGETIGSLAVRYGISIEKIMSANTNVNPTRLQIDQKIIIPVSSLNRNAIRSKSIRLASRSLMGGNENGSMKSGRLVWPAYGQFSSPYGWRGREFHRGVDIAASHGTRIVAAMDGQVISAGWEGGYGNMLQVRHYNGFVTRYAHCSKFYVTTGQHVNAGQLIAAIGTTGNTTGPHLHFEVMVNGSQVNPKSYF